MTLIEYFKMSFLDELKNRKSKLKNTNTTITHADGTMFVENLKDSHVKEKIQTIKCYGFVVDTKPDNIPVCLIPGLFIGSQDCCDVEILKKYNINNVLSVGIEISNDNVLCQFVPCLDLPETDIKPILETSVRFIQKVLDAGENVLVHCNAGVSRAATVCIGFLILNKGFSFADAYNLVKMKRPAIQPNAGFLAQLKCL